MNSWTLLDKVGKISKEESIEIEEKRDLEFWGLPTLRGWEKQKPEKKNEWEKPKKKKEHQESLTGLTVAKGRGKKNQD